MVSERPDSIRQARFIARLPEEKDRRFLEEKVLARELTTAQVVEMVQTVEEGQDVEKAVASLLSPPVVRPSAPLRTGAVEPPVVAPSAAVEPVSALSEGPAVSRQAAVPAEERLLDPRPILRAVRDQLRQIEAEHLDTLEPRRGWGIRKLLEEIIAEATALRDRLPRAN
jgi:hypothetical protein